MTQGNQTYKQIDVTFLVTLPSRGRKRLPQAILKALAAAKVVNLDREVVSVVEVPVGTNVSRATFSAPVNNGVVTPTVVEWIE